MDLKARVHIERAKSTTYIPMGNWSSTLQYKLSDMGIPIVKVPNGTAAGFSAYALNVDTSTTGASPAGTGSSQWRLVESAEFIYMLEAYVESLRVGKFESNIDGRKVIIDPESRGIIMKDTNDRVVAHIAFYSNDWSELSFRSYHSNGNISRITSVSNNVGYLVQEYSTSGSLTSEIRYGMDGAIINGKLINLSDAQAEALLISGQWYRTGNIVKVRT